MTRVARMMMRIRLRIGKVVGVGGATRLYAPEDVRCYLL
jgi:hypothetical protein